MYKIIILMGLSVVLLGCQVMTVSECQHANWAELGRQDGLRGYSANVYSRSDACLKHQVVIPAEKIAQYQRSYTTAIHQYCQPQNIFNLAIAGEGRISACPEPQYSQVKTIYAVGSNYYNKKQEIEEVQQRIRWLDEKIDETQNRQQRYEYMDEQRKKAKFLNRLLDEQKVLQRELDWIRPR